MPLLTVLTGLTGLGLGTWGWFRYARHRFRVRDASAARLGRRTGLVMFGVGGLLAVAPDLPSAALDLGGPASTGVVGVLSAVTWFVYRLVMVAGFGFGALSLFLMSETVTRPVRRGVDAASMAVQNGLAQLPVGAGRAARQLRRDPGLRDFPRGWADVVEHERALTTRLLAYERDPELAASRPAMRDYSDPATAAAVRAMMAADFARLSTPPVRGGDALLTAYGRSVAEFAAALDAAEANAALRATSNLHDGERAALDEAGRILAYLTSNASTPAERTAAYEQVTATLGAAARHTPQVVAGERTHPWLDVAERA